MDPKTIAIIIFLDILMGAVPGIIAQRNHRSFFLWWVYGVLLLPIALPHALILSTRLIVPTRKCGYCRTSVRVDKAFCPRCGYEFVDFTENSRSGYR